MRLREEGRKLFIGETNPDVNCASCHGKDGKPVIGHFRVGKRMKLSPIQCGPGGFPKGFPIRR